MKKIINDPANFVDEVVDGLLLAHGNELRAVSEDQRALVRSDAGTGGKVGIVTGGGSGHMPFFLGYVGQGLASGVAVGNVFSSPSPGQIHAATVASDAGAGVLYLYGNYGGDVYNFDIAADMADADGIEVTTVLGTDDLLSAPPERIDTRRGVAGLIFAYKTAGAAAERGANLREVTEVAQRTVARTRTIGVGLSPTILPAAGEPTFTLADGEMEIGIGIHGEPGNRRIPLESADAITDRFLTELLTELKLSAGDRVAVLVNGLGATPLEELFLIYRRTHRALADLGVIIHRKYIGEYATSLEMAGASLSILHLDDELAELIDAPARSPFFTQGAIAPSSADGAASSQKAFVAHHAAPEPAEIRTIAEPGKLREVVLAVTAQLPQYASELRELDAALGDGDLGITVGDGSTAARLAVEALPVDAHPSEIFKAIGAAFASANPSTYAALVGSGLMASGRAVAEVTTFSTPELAVAGRALLEHIKQRGGAELGDKTVVDVIDPVVAILENSTNLSPRELADVSVQVARDAVAQGASRTSKRGRASWVGDRSVGHRDPGSVAFLRLIEEIQPTL